VPQTPDHSTPGSLDGQEEYTITGVDQNPPIRSLPHLQHKQFIPIVAGQPIVLE
jgi:hypothetical protein